MNTVETAIKVTQTVIPTIYAYTTPEIARHNGCTKIGYTEQTSDKRLGQQGTTIDVIQKLEWKGNAIFEDGSGETFTDNDFHAYLLKNGFKKLEGQKGKDWIRIEPSLAKQYFYEYRENHGISTLNDAVIPYSLRKEQKKAVEQTLAFLTNHNNGEFLWNAKPRFGKTLTTYDLCLKSNANNVLIVTNRPAIADSWFSDYVTFLGRESGYYFVSETDTLKDCNGVLTRKEFSLVQKKDKCAKCIEFVSLQDLKGSIHFGGSLNKLEEIKKTFWDILVVDEAHEGIDTYKTDVAFDQINRGFTLHLSGTPFKALASDKFPSDAIFNWTYADEQQSKENWDDASGETNPYASLPKLNLFTYKMSDIVQDELSKGVVIDGESVKYAFELNEFFAVDKSGSFVHDEAIDKFLDALTLQKKFPFSTESLRNELKHTLWILNHVESAKALARKLQEHPIFKTYNIVLAAGDGKLSEDEESIKSLAKVRAAIKKYDKTITISVGQLTTGVTIKEWTAVLMLSTMKSPAQYMQAAFRAQNPYLFAVTKNNKTVYKRKENAYVFDFDPARTLTIYEQFANDLSIDTASGKGSSNTHKENVKKLLNFFPVIGEDENGELTELDADNVLLIPRKIRSKEVVRSGFMSNYLFQNISNVFSAPTEVLDIIQSFEPIGELKVTPRITGEDTKKISLGETGDVLIDDKYVIGLAHDTFGDKIYEPNESYNYKDEIQNAIDNLQAGQGTKSALTEFKNFISNNVISDIVKTTEYVYGDQLRGPTKKRITKKLQYDSNNVINRTVEDYDRKQKIIEQERLDALQNRTLGESTSDINKKYDLLLKKVAKETQATLNNAVEKFISDSMTDVVRIVETDKQNQIKEGIEGKIRDHLRGFSRTIPAFLMAYGNENVTLATFDTIIPDNVFKEVTSIDIKQFKFLRDGGEYPDEKTGEIKHFNGQLFDEIVFNDSVKEFLELKRKLSNYFDEKNEEDIFDYIPPQRTNQIFTPKAIVKHMVDDLEKVSPGCFNDPNKTFIDLYMKSGLYIAEIVKRLYQSKKMVKLYPNSDDRLTHIFEKQVYGLAPSEIIFNIAINFILGFDENKKITKHNFRQVDALPYAKNGTLQDFLDGLYLG